MGKEKTEMYEEYLDNIFEDPSNPNKMTPEQITALSNSMKKYGLIVPIIINQDNVIIDGHQRKIAAEKLGLKKHPVIKINTNEFDQKLLKQILNKLKGRHDPNLDLDEYKHLYDQDKELNSLKEFVAMDEEIIESIINLIENPLKDKTDEELDESISLEGIKTDIVRGDIILLGKHRLMCGDSTNKEDVDKLMNNKKVILMVTDPPYGVNYNPKWRDDADKMGTLDNRYPTRSLGNVMNDDKNDWTEAYKLFNCDVLYVWHARIYASEVALSLERLDYKIISQIIWSKPHFALSRGDYHWKHEPCWYAVKNGKQHNWQGDRTQCTVWEIAGMNAMGASKEIEDKASGHGTQKPIKCMSIPILNNSKPKDIIIDPFLGSGSTLIACEKEDRICYGMELNPTYCEIVCQRYEKLTGKKRQVI